MSPPASGSPTTQTRPVLQSPSAPDCATWFDGSAATDLSSPQKLIGHTPPPIASEGQNGGSVTRSTDMSTGASSPPSTGLPPAT